MFVHQRKHGRWIAMFPKGTLSDDPGRTRKYFGRGIEAETVARPHNESLSLIKHASEHLKRFLIIAYYCGARSGASELLSLTWDKVDLDGGTILIVSARKSGRESRLIPLNADFKKFLAQSKAEDGDKIRYLITWRGKPVKRIVGAFKRAKRKAKIDPNRKLPPDAFRHAFITTALSSGGDLKGVFEMAGHSRTESTTRIYQHTNINLHRGIVENLPPIALDG